MITYVTTEISIAREVPGAERWETTLSTVATGIRAHIEGVSGIYAMGVGGTTSEVTHTMFADPCDLRVGDVVTDHEGLSYDVESTFIERGPLPHVLARLVRKTMS